MAGDNLDQVTKDVKKALDEFLGLTISNTGKRRAALEMRMAGLIRLHVQLERSRSFATVKAANDAVLSVIANGGSPQSIGIESLRQGWGLAQEHRCEQCIR